MLRVRSQQSSDRNATRWTCRWGVSRCAGTGDSLCCEQLCTSSPDDYAALQMQMASGTVLQVDKTAPAHQGLFRNHGECCQDSSLDRSLRLCVGGDSQKAAQFGPQPLHNFTDFEPHAFRESPNLTSSYRIHEYDSGAR